jgi:hypothetical protein
MVLNSDYSPFPGSSNQALTATAGHEFNHAIQFGIGALSGSNYPEDAFVEGGATWVEDEVFDAANDNYNYLWPKFNMCMGQYTNSPYAYWLTFRGLTERFGPGVAGGAEQVMQDFWELASKGVSANLNAINQALVNRGTNLADAFHAYAIAIQFAKPCTGGNAGYAYPYCMEEGANYVSKMGSTPSVHGTISSSTGSYAGSSLPDYFSINWVRLTPTTAPYSVSLTNNSGGQLRGSVVCDTGSTLRVQPLPAVVGSGASTVLNYFDPTGCVKVVAVITNQQHNNVDDPGSCTGRSYTLRLSAATSPLLTPRLFLALIYASQ